MTAPSLCRSLMEGIDTDQVGEIDNTEFSVECYRGFSAAMNMNHDTLPFIQTSVSICLSGF
jgi:hypothetical protein